MPIAPSGFANGRGNMDRGGGGAPLLGSLDEDACTMIHVPQSLVQVETKVQMTSGIGGDQTRNREKGEAKWVLLDSVLAAREAAW